MQKKQRLKAGLLKEIAKRLHHQRQYEWTIQARPAQQIPEGNWRTWLILAGRGFGKTRTGAETIRTWAESGLYKRIALIGATLAEAEAVMVDGQSGLLAVHPLQTRPKFLKSKRQLIWPNGAIATLYGAESYEHLRGPQFDCAWIDEFAKFRHTQKLWEQLQLCLRLGDNPRCIITTTPKPLPLLEKLIASEDIFVTRGSTFENEANLSPIFLEQVRKQFAGTRIGAQELYAKILSQTMGALWQWDMISYGEPDVNEDGTYKLERIVIAIDPATTHHETSDETGIIVAGIDDQKRAYILEDISGKWSPHDWGQRVTEAYQRFKADRVVAEINKGGDLVERVLCAVDPTLAFKAVRATRGKYTRAEPIAALYEQKRVFHLKSFRLLEQQMCDYVPGVTSKSPDRMDALVWAVTDLLLEGERHPTLKTW